MRSRNPSDFAALGAVAFAAALTACAPLQKEAPPSITHEGYGVVEKAVNFNTKGGESATNRAVIGLISGGLVGFAIAGSTEENINRTEVWQYSVRRSGGLEFFQSNAVVAVGDCVKIEKIAESHLSVLTKVPRKQC